MDFTVVGLLAEAHNRVMRTLASRVGGDHNGLTILARAARVRRLIDNRMAKRIERLDMVFAVVRHATPEKLASFMDQLQEMLQNNETAYMYKQKKRLPPGAGGEDENIAANVVTVESIQKEMTGTTRDGDGINLVTISIPHKRGAAAGMASGKVKQQRRWQPKAFPSVGVVEPYVDAVGDSSRCVRVAKVASQKELVDRDLVLMQKEKSAGSSDDPHAKRFGEEGCLDLREAQAMRTHGNQLYKAGQTQEALETYSLALRQIAPVEKHEMAILLCNRAACLQKLTQWDEVAADCTRAITLDPDYPKALYRRSIALEAMGQWIDALTDLELAIHKEPAWYDTCQEQRTRLVRLVQDQLDRGEACEQGNIADEDWKELTPAEEEELRNATAFWDWYSDLPAELQEQHDAAMSG